MYTECRNIVDFTKRTDGNFLLVELNMYGNRAHETGSTYMCVQSLPSPQSQARCSIQTGPTMPFCMTASYMVPSITPTFHAAHCECNASMFHGDNF